MIPFLRPLRLLPILSLVAILRTGLAQGLEEKPSDPLFDPFQPRKAPAAVEHLRKGDRLAIIGDSITEQ